jgi:hypothetical protein
MCHRQRPVGPYSLIEGPQATPINTSTVYDGSGGEGGPHYDAINNVVM